MKKIVLDMQSWITARALERILLQDMSDCQPILSEAPDQTAEQCRLFRPDILLMEVTGYTPWTLKERLRLCCDARRASPACKLIFLTDENADPAVADQVVQCKKDGRIDAFLFSSASDKYLVAVLDSV